ncbi:hypothetical protein RB614_14475 [Phytohabitans sp. ZYX-F-186]|uniref:Uncharacterized protein n=1 Tax=Phytohabitans maris TaxID=3071409 RepID=A0ABU0ZGX1_9ACTN|nr:hypothetical protein [Phytohabitans sp. ZYX-F-186]MDQ7905721.1 hypothetical protein [Phytohabitans sp. ZYX-F-186]
MRQVEDVSEAAMPPEYATEAADRSRAAAAEIERRLGQLGRYLAGLDPDGLDLPTARFDALLTAYDVYTRMLTDALDDIAAALDRRSTPEGPPVPPAAVVAGTASQVLAELESLKRVLEPLAGTPAGAEPWLGPTDEWTIATDGLFGPTGVLGVIVRASGAAWPDQRVAAWSA